MSSGIENSTQTHDSTTETIDLRHRKEPEMDSPDNEFFTNEITHSSLSEQIKQAAGSILWQIEELYSLLASHKELETTENSEATSSRRGNTCAIPVLHEDVSSLEQTACWVSINLKKIN